MVSVGHSSGQVAREHQINLSVKLVCPGKAESASSKASVAGVAVAKAVVPGNASTDEPQRKATPREAADRQGASRPAAYSGTSLGLAPVDMMQTVDSLIHNLCIGARDLWSACSICLHCQ